MTGNVTTMQVASARFGTLETSEDEVVTIEGGLLGFPDANQFVRFPVPDAEGWLWLQSITDRELAFLAIEAFRFFPAYDIELDESDVGTLDLVEPTDAEILALVTVRHDDAGALVSITANLLGPLVINTRTTVGRQVVLADSRHSTREPLVG